jgi:hypothetical protein
VTKKRKTFFTTFTPVGQVSSTQSRRKSCHRERRRRHGRLVDVGCRRAVVEGHFDVVGLELVHRRLVRADALAGGIQVIGDHAQPPVHEEGAQTEPGLETTAIAATAKELRSNLSGKLQTLLQIS